MSITLRSISSPSFFFKISTNYTIDSIVRFRPQRLRKVRTDVLKSFFDLSRQKVSFSSSIEVFFFLFFSLLLLLLMPINHRRDSHLSWINCPFFSSLKLAVEKEREREKKKKSKWSFSWWSVRSIPLTSWKCLSVRVFCEIRLIKCRNEFCRVRRGKKNEVSRWFQQLN